MFLFRRFLIKLAKVAKTYVFNSFWSYYVISVLYCQQKDDHICHLNDQDDLHAIQHDIAMASSFSAEDNNPLYPLTLFLEYI